MIFLAGLELSYCPTPAGIAVKAHAPEVFDPTPRGLTQHYLAAMVENFGIQAVVTYTVDDVEHEYFLTDRDERPVAEVMPFDPSKRRIKH